MDPALPVLRRGAQVCGPARQRLEEQVRAAYEAGESIRALAERLGRSYGFVHGLLTDAGVRLRRRGMPRGKAG